MNHTSHSLSRRRLLVGMHHHFPVVRSLPDGGLRVVDGPAGFTGSAEQLAFAVAAWRELWGHRPATTATWRDHANRALTRAGHRTDAASRSPLALGHSNLKLRPEWRGLWVLDGLGAEDLGQKINDIGFWMER
jgi:hypothetical protein